MPVIFPGVGYIWPNFLPAHNDMALGRKLSTHLWACILMYFHTTICICLEDCLRVFSGGWLSNRGKKKLSTRTELNFYDDSLNFDCIISWGIKTKKEKNISQVFNTPHYFVRWPQLQKTRTNANLGSDVRVWPGLRSQWDMADWASLEFCLRKNQRIILWFIFSK